MEPTEGPKPEPSGSDPRFRPEGFPPQPIVVKPGEPTYGYAEGVKPTEQAPEVRWEQMTTRRETLELSGEKFAKDQIDFAPVMQHLKIHTDGEVAGSQFNGELFASPDALVAFVREQLPDQLEWDADGRVELTLTVPAEQPLGWSGVQSIAEAKATYPDLQVVQAVRTPGGTPGEVGGVAGAWYPETRWDPERKQSVIVQDAEGNITNPQGKFEPLANIAEVPRADFARTAETRQVTLVLERHPETRQPVVRTIFPGENAPQFPAKIQSEAYQSDTLANRALQEFWGSHVFLKAVEQPAEQVAAPEVREAERQSEGERAYEELRAMFESQEFADRLVIAQASGEQQALEEGHGNLRKVVEQRLRVLKDAAALTASGKTDLAAARKDGRAWGAALKAVTEVKVPSADGGVETLSIEAVSERFTNELLDQPGSAYKEQIESAEMALAHAFDRERARADALRIELIARKDDPALRQALEAWGQSPNAKGERKADGEGFNAGVVHYFEYRADLTKRGRFKGETEFSIDDFIQYSERLRTLMDEHASNPELDGAALLADEAGQQRLFLITKSGERIVCFKGMDDPNLQVISILPGGKLKDLDKLVAEELDTTNGKVAVRLNKLEGAVRIVYDSRQASGTPPAAER